MSTERIDFGAFSVSGDGLSTWRQCLRLLRIQRDSDQVLMQGLSEDLDRALSSIRALTATVEELQQAIRKVGA